MSAARRKQRELRGRVVVVTGAAGGLGAGLKAFLNAELRRGVDLVLDLTDLNEQLRGADLVLTAEGQIDFQTAFGKAPAGVAERAHALGVPCLAIAGRVGGGLESLHALGIDAAFSLCPGPVSLEQAMAAIIWPLPLSRRRALSWRVAADPTAGMPHLYPSLTRPN